MADFILLNSIFLIFLLITIIESNFKTSFQKLSLLTKIYIATYLVIAIFLTTSTIFSNTLLISKYLYFSFLVLSFGHLVFLLTNQNYLSKTAIFVTILVIIFYHFTYPSPLSQNLFITTAIIWLGPFLTKAKILTKKRLIILSFIWLIWTIVFLLKYPATYNLFIKNENTRLAYSLRVGDTYLGMIDLIWPNLFISLIRQRILKLISVGLFILTNFIIGITAYQFNLFSVFPIVLIWILVGLPLLYFDKK